MRLFFFYNIGIYHSRFPISNDRSFEHFFRAYTQDLPPNIPYVTLLYSFKKSGRQNILIPELYLHSYTHTHTHTHTHTLFLSLSVSLPVYSYVYKYGFIWNYINMNIDSIYIYIIILSYVMAYSKVPSHIP